MKDNKCTPMFLCEGESDCVYGGHKDECLYKNGIYCASVVAIVNVMTLLLKDLEKGEG